MIDSLAAVVVLYHPDFTVINNINSYLNHIDALVVIDNSEEINHSLINKLSQNPKIHYLPNGGNQGIAHALNAGASKAIELGYQWLLTMDQDSHFEREMITAYLDCWLKYGDKQTVAIFSPVHNVNNSLSSASVSCTATAELTTMTSGNLLNLEIFQKIGHFEEKLFIDEVDHDYCLKANLSGYKVICFSNVLLNHELGEAKTIKNLTYRTHSPQRFYYFTRNHLYMWHKYRSSFPHYIRSRMINLLKTIMVKLYYDKQKLRVLANVLLGIFHFMVGRYGK
jgi:rhamnosyltransferase